MSDKSLHTRLEEEISGKEPGKILFPTDFLKLGSPEAIHMALSRLTKQKIITRLGKGIYVKPKTDPLLGTVLPSLEEIARAIAENEKVVIRPTGAFALNRLGLSTQVPTKVVFLTNGSRRLIKIRRGTIAFKPTTPKNLAAENEIVFLVIQALIELGEAAVTENLKKILSDRLAGVSPGEIRSDARYAPQFAAKLLHEIANKLAHDG